jgi:fibronectin type 3 domain-containing protein
MVTQGGNQPVALLFAGDGTLTIGNPIVPVLQRFGVTIEGQPPGDGPPGVPTSLSALAGAGSVALSWNAPAFDGGSPISNYKVYRGTSPGAVSFHANAGTTTSYADTSASNGTTYYYKVSAENANGEGPLSNEGNATPTDLVAPAEPLVALDTFNRANENPLSDSGNWSTNLNGGLENGLHVNANQLACSATSTCTGWRKTQYGPDAEAWARVATLPGTGNAIRLYVRVQSPGTSAYDGYMLLVSQQAGTDQATIYRITNSGLTALLTVPQELTAGDTVLLRAKGSALEAWRYDGAAWSRFGLVQDATYAGAGFTGIGIRGTTGRLDDFGARTMGVPPPDTEPPTAPGTLTATPFSSSQIQLSWGPATDNVGPVSYRIERCSGSGCSNFAEIAAGTSTTHMDVFLDASTEYSYRVRAVDGADNEGLYSNTASATTPAPPDTEPPSAPTTLNASAVSSTQIDLTWTGATDNVAVTLYRVERCSGVGCSSFTEIGTTASTGLSDSGRSPSTSYSYRVRAQDAVPNLGGYSNTASATTLSDAVPPAEPLSILDSFNRRNENPLGGNWTNGIIGAVETGLRVSSSTLECTKTTTCTAWRTEPAYGPDTEVYARVAALPGTSNGFRLYARLQGAGTSAQTGYMLRTNQLTGTDQVFLDRVDGSAIVTRLTIAQELLAGDTLLHRVKGSRLEAWLKRGTTWTLLGSVADSTYAAAGSVGVGIRGKSGRLDDFGAR